MDNKKLIPIFLLCVAVVISLGFVGLQAFAKKIYDSRSCDFGVIDNIELHTRTNIPKVSNTECDYDEALNAKKVIFTLDTSSYELSDYIKESNFIKATSKTVLPLHDILSFEKDISQFENPDDLYYKNDTHFSLILNAKLQKIWVYLKY